MISMKISEAANSLRANYYGEDTRFFGCSCDSRKLHKGELFIALKGENFDGHDFIEDAQSQGACGVITEIDKPCDLTRIVVEDSRHAMGTLAKCWRKEFDIPLVAITGSNGKTTVKEMLTAILRLKAPVLATKGNLNNEIGVPLTLFGLGNEHQYAVIEMGANHPGEIAWLSEISQPTVAVITQCAPAHLEGYGSIEGVAKAKAEIFDNLDPKGIAVINADDEHSELWRKKVTVLRQLSFGIKKPADVSAHSIHQSIKSGKTHFVLSLPTEKLDIILPVLGQHNVMNALAAVACALSLNIDHSLIKKGLENFEPSQGRLQIIIGLRNSNIINDTYNANPASLNAALNVLSDFMGTRWLVLGDMGELGPEAVALHSEAGKMAKASGVDKVYAYGDLSKAAVTSFGGGARHFRDIDQLISTICDEINNDVTVLVKGSRAMQMERVVLALTRDN